MLSKRTTTLLIVALTAALISMTATSTLFYVIYKKSAVLYELNKALLTATNEESTYSAMKHLLSETKVERAKLDSYFVGNDNAASFEFIDSIEDLSRIARVDSSVNNVNLEPFKGNETFEQVSVNVTSEGTFNNIYWFLALMEALPLQHELQSISLDKISDNPKKENLWRLAFTIRATKLK